MKVVRPQAGGRWVGSHFKKIKKNGKPEDNHLPFLFIFLKKYSNLNYLFILK